MAGWIDGWMVVCVCVCVGGWKGRWMDILFGGNLGSCLGVRLISWLVHDRWVRR